MVRNAWNNFVATYRASHPSATMTQCSAAYRSNKKRAGSSSKTHRSKTYRSGEASLIRSVTMEGGNLVIKISKIITFSEEHQAIEDYFRRYFQGGRYTPTFEREGHIFIGTPSEAGKALARQFNPGTVP